MQQPIVPSGALRLVLVVAAAVFVVLASPTPVAANDPSPWLLEADEPDLRLPPVMPDRAVPIPTPTPPPTPSPSPTPTPTPPPSVGYDISYPQCGASVPDEFAFAIVGVNGGRVYDINPCFAPDGDEPSQLEWAGQDVELYFNTGNPGPRVSRFWPMGQDAPRACDRSDQRGPDTLDCAYVYGWNASEHAYQAALEAYTVLGWVERGARRLPDQVTIWLDVEIANSWRSDPELNVAALEGAVAYLESMRVGRIGFYSTPRLWERITGGTDIFADHPAWHAGALDRADAERRCRDEQPFTGGELAMVQWVEDGLDANIRCESD